MKKEQKEIKSTGTPITYEHLAVFLSFVCLFLIVFFIGRHIYNQGYSQGYTDDMRNESFCFYK